MDDKSKHGGRSSPVYAHKFVDDYGLTPATFRVLFRIGRRAGGYKGECYESIPHMARACRLKAPTVRAAIKFLVEHKIITFMGEHPEKKTKRYKLAPMDQWAPPQKEEHPDTRF